MECFYRLSLLQLSQNVYVCARMSLNVLDENQAPDNYCMELLTTVSYGICHDQEHNEMKARWAPYTSPLS